MLLHPQTAAAITADKPTAPQPNTAILSFVTLHIGREMISVFIINVFS
jgi:hypothetical protein